MTDRAPVYDIIKYILRGDADNRLTQGDNLLQYDGTRTVFFPSQEQPESTIPYAIYTTSDSNDAESWWMNYEEATFMLFDIPPKSQAIINEIKDQFQRGDESARELMSWLRANNEPIDFKFHHFEWVGGGQLQPTNEEGGAMGRMFTIRYSFTYTSGRGIG